MATRTASPKTKPATRATTKRAAPRKTPARKAPAKKAAAGAKGGATTAALATLRRNAFPLAGAIAAGAATAAALFFKRRTNVLAEGHPAPDLDGDTHPGADDRADPHFRPDMDAPMTDADRAALAPATSVN